jgi:hypothetical protein
VPGVANNDAVGSHVNQRNHCNVIHAVPQMQEESPAKRPRLDTRDDGVLIVRQRPRTREPWFVFAGRALLVGLYSYWIIAKVSVSCCCMPPCRNCYSVNFNNCNAR